MLLAATGWFEATHYELTRLVLQRGFGLIYLVAFAVAALQFRPLLGEHGLLPVPRFVAAVPFRRSPSVFHLHYSDRFLLAVASAGMVLAASVVSGLAGHAPIVVCVAVWLAMWVLYLSIVNVGQTFYSFGWETLLLEAGFLAAFLGPEHVAPPVVVLWLFRWLAIRVEFGAGLIKLRGDRCWRDLTCLYYHHETQPLPNPLSWHFHHLPKPLHRVEVAANHVAQLVLPLVLVVPQPFAAGAAILIIATQCWLILSGNFSWLNAITIVIVAAALPDRALDPLLPAAGSATAAPRWWAVVVIAVAIAIVGLSGRPARNLLSRRQLMNSSFNSLRLVNTYGAFGSVTKTRNELVVEGTDDERPSLTTVWREYEFKAKPGDTRRRPRQIAPYHLRLDWLMWFAAMRPPGFYPWLRVFLERLLAGDRATLSLLRHNPFPDAPPKFVRVVVYHYRFSTRAERRQTGQWWIRTRLGVFTPPVQRSRRGSVLL